MSKHPLRNDTICLNCGHHVDERYCSECGQENIESRQSFADLTTHFIEDLTHYDGKFWATLQYLFFRPAYLSKLYLSGRRSSFLPPIRLYIFASFITFLLPHLLPDVPDSNRQMDKEQALPMIDTNVIVDTMSFYYDPSRGMVLSSPFKTLHKLDSAREAKLLSGKPMAYDDYFMFKKSIELQKYTPAEIYEKFKNSISQSFPKALFLYMPLFAFLLWVFHSRKKWLYFDHSIFTLHYFSFLLLLFSLLIFIKTAGGWICWWLGQPDLFDTFLNVLYLLVFLWYIFYFFRAHRVMYAESWIISVIKGLCIFTLNIAVFFVLMVALVALTIWMLH